MGRWSLSASFVPRSSLVVCVLVCFLVERAQASVIRYRRDGANPSLQLLLSDVHHDIYTGSNKEDGDGNGNWGNQVNKVVPDPVKAPEVAQIKEAPPPPDPIPAPDPVKPPEPDPVQVPDLPQVDLAGSANPDPQQVAPDKSNNEDGDGHGNNGGFDKPSIDHASPPEPQKPQQQQEEQQQQQQQQEDPQQQQQEAPPTPEPPPPPDTPEPIPPGEMSADIQSNLADQISDDDSSEEKSIVPDNFVDQSLTASDAKEPAAAPEPTEGQPTGPPPPVPNYNDPFDPFIHPNHPPPPPPPPDFHGSINVGLAGGPPPPPPPSSAFMPPPPPPPSSNFIPPPPPPPMDFIPPPPGNHPHPPAPFGIIRGFDNPPPFPAIINSLAPQPPPKKPAGANENVAPEDKLAAELAAQAEARSLALDKHSDLLDMRHDQLANIPKPETPSPWTPPPLTTPPTPKPISAADLKSAVADKAADALDMQRDLFAIAKEKELAAREAATGAKESVVPRV